MAAQHPEVAPPTERVSGQAPLAGGLDPGWGWGAGRSSRPSVLQPALLCEAQPGAFDVCVPGPARPGPVWAGMLAPPSGCGCSSAETRLGLPLPVQTLLSWDLRSLRPPPSVLREGEPLVGLGGGCGGQTAWAGTSSGSWLDLGDRMPGLRGQWARWWGLGKRSFLTAAPLVLPGSCGPAGITPQTRLRGPAAGLSDPLGKRWAGVTPVGLTSLLGLSLPPGDHARCLPAWLCPPSAGLEGTLGGLAPAGLQAELGHWTMPCPALGGGRQGRVHSGSHSLLCPLLGWGMILHGSRTVPELQAPGG